MLTKTSGAFREMSTLVTVGPMSCFFKECLPLARRKSAVLNEMPLFITGRESGGRVANGHRCCSYPGDLGSSSATIVK